MEERHLPRLSRRCHGWICPGRMLISRRLLREGCLPRWDHSNTIGFFSVIDGATRQVDWRVAMIADLVREIKILPGNGGWNASLSKRECL
jgi:hypothetical protein